LIASLLPGEKEGYMQSSTKHKKGISAWLITWEYAGEHAKPERKIAAILNPRWSSDHVREYMELLYTSLCYTISERIAYAKNRSFNPYPAEYQRENGIPWQGQITCGHNPWLFARLVDDLAAKGDPDEEEQVQWSERPKPDFKKMARAMGIHRIELP
jgi:hypothetical protein